MSENFIDTYKYCARGAAILVDDEWKIVTKCVADSDEFDDYGVFFRDATEVEIADIVAGINEQEARKALLGQAVLDSQQTLTEILEVLLEKNKVAHLFVNACLRNVKAKQIELLEIFASPALVGQTYVAATNFFFYGGNLPDKFIAVSSTRKPFTEIYQVDASHWDKLLAYLEQLPDLSEAQHHVQLNRSVYFFTSNDSPSFTQGALIDYPCTAALKSVSLPEELNWVGKWRVVDLNDQLADVEALREKAMLREDWQMMGDRYIVHLNFVQDAQTQTFPT